MQVGQVSVGISLGSDALIDLEDMDLGPRHLFRCKIPQHGPRSLAATNGKSENSTSSHGLTGGSCNYSCGGLRHRIIISKDLDLKSHDLKLVR